MNRLLALLALLLTVAPVNIASTQVNSREGGALIFQINETEYARISETAGNVGIGTTNPLAKLEVTGNVSVTGIIDVGHTALACSTAISGSIRYETTSDTLQVCTGSGWRSLTSTTTAGVIIGGSDTNVQYNSSGSLSGTNAFAFVPADGSVSLTRISATNISGTTAQLYSIASYALAAETVSSTNISASVIWGTTISATGAAGTVSATRIYGRDASFTTVTATAVNGTRISGTYVYGNQISGTQLWANRISATSISTTSIIQVASTTAVGCVSAVQGSIRYTYPSDTLQICTGSGWKSLVSGSTALSETDPKVGTLSSGQICHANAAATSVVCDIAEGSGGGLDADTLDGQDSTFMVPSGAVMAFDLAACPSGWTAYASGVDRMIVGSGSSYARGATGGAETITLTTSELPAHSHTVDPAAATTSTGGSHAHSTYAAQNAVTPNGSTGVRVTGLTGVGGANVGATSSDGSHSHSVDIPSTATSSEGSGAAFSNLPPYVALLYCKKN